MNVFVWLGSWFKPLFISGFVLAGIGLLTYPQLFAEPLPFKALPIAMNADQLRVGITANGLTSFYHSSVRVMPFRPDNGLKSLALRDANGKLLWQGSSTFTIRWTGTRWQLHLGANIQTLSSTPKLRLDPGETGTLVALPSLKRPGSSVARYRGGFELLAKPNHCFMVINLVEMQDYLKAVVPNELPIKYGVEAVKAQSVAARNYALRPRDKFWTDFDICDSQYCQAYYGAQTETPETSQALEDTQGLVALYNGELVLTLFSSASGGYNEAYENVFSDPKTKAFPATPLNYLPAKPDDLVNGALGAMPDLSSEAAARAFWTRRDVPSYDATSPNYRWERRWTLPQLQHDVATGLWMVSKDGATRDFISPSVHSPASVGRFQSFRITRRGRSGKAMILEVSSNRGHWIIKKEFLIRQVLNTGGKRLPSGNVVFTESRDARGQLIGLLAQGGGLGHGVGLSQLGASTMARLGMHFDEILAAYYPGAVLATRPIQASVDQPQQLNFYVPSGFRQARLWMDGVVEGTQVRINQQAVKAKQGVSVHKWLQAGQDNQLFVQSKASNALPVRAWVTLSR